MEREAVGGFYSPGTLTFSKWSPRRLQAAATAVVFPLPGGPRKRTLLVPVSRAPLKSEDGHLSLPFCPNFRVPSNRGTLGSRARPPPPGLFPHGKAIFPTLPMVWAAKIHSLLSPLCLQ